MHLASSPGRLSATLARFIMPMPCRLGGFYCLVLAAIAVLNLSACANENQLGPLNEDQLRTLNSLRAIPGTNAYVMDYYGDYHLDRVREEGIDIQNIAGSFVGVLFPELPEQVAQQLRREFLNIDIEALDSEAHRCSTVVSRAEGGDVVFGRNFDWKNDACLVLKIHDAEGVASIAVIDLAYLNLNRRDLEQASLRQRVPLLFAPYYVMDGMNRHGVAISDMALRGAQAPRHEDKPDVLLSTAMRLVLDNAASTAEAVELLGEYNLYFAETPCHLMIADAAGEATVVEFIDGELTCTPATEPWQVCTNHCIAGNTEAQNDGQCSRYLRASDTLEGRETPADTEAIMEIMESVSAENRTMWTSVYNLTTGEMQFAYRGQFDDEHADQLDRAE